VYAVLIRDSQYLGEWCGEFFEREREREREKTFFLKERKKKEHFI